VSKLNNLFLRQRELNKKPKVNSNKIKGLAKQTRERGRGRERERERERESIRHVIFITTCTFMIKVKLNSLN